MNMFKIRYSYGKVGSDKLKIGDTEYRFPYLYTIKDDGSGWTWSDYGSSDNVYTECTIRSWYLTMLPGKLQPSTMRVWIYPYSMISLRLLWITSMNSVMVFIWNVNIYRVLWV